MKIGETSRFESQHSVDILHPDAAFLTGLYLIPEKSKGIIFLDYFIPVLTKIPIKVKLILYETNTTFLVGRLYLIYGNEKDTNC